MPPGIIVFSGGIMIFMLPDKGSGEVCLIIDSVLHF